MADGTKPLPPPPTGGHFKKTGPRHGPGEACAGKAGPPFSNTGVTQSAALVDFVAVSIALSNFRDPAGPERFLLPKNDAELSAAIGTVRFWNLAQTFFNQAFPGTCIEAKPFERKGTLGYTFSAPLVVQGVEGQVGIIACGGNASTIHISLTGSGCVWLTEMLRMRLSLEGLGAKLTRVDVAFDDLEGTYLDVKSLASCAAAGLFKHKRAGQQPNMRLIDDLGTRKGCSLYVGTKGSKELNVYDKGKQLGQPLSRWVRAEARLWAKDRVIPWDTLTDPGAYLRGEYPFLAELLPAHAPKRSKIEHAKAEATIEAAERWLKNAAGKTINFLARGHERAGFHPADLVQDLSRDGTPKRFAGIPEEVAFARVEKRGTACDHLAQREVMEPADYYEQFEFEGANE